MKQGVEVKGRSLYDSAVRSGSAREQLAKAPGLLQAWKDDYSKSFEGLNLGVKHYGGISKLEDDSCKFASKLRESEERLKNDLGGRSFFKKEMDVGKYWDAGLLGEFRDFEGVVGTGYGKFIGDVYAKLNKRRDVLVSPKRRVKIAGGISLGGVYGVMGVMSGGFLGAVSEGLVTGLSVELSSPVVIAGAVAGGVGAVAFVYYAMKGKILFSTTNPLSDGADDLEKRVGVIRKALGCGDE